MALPNGSNTPPISIGDINAEFGFGNDLASYHGQLFGRPDSTAGLFPATAISLADFYNTQKAVASSTTSMSSGSFTIPPYKTITFTATGGNGGQAGAYGYFYLGPSSGTPTASGGGGAGGASSAGSLVSGAGGAGGGGNAGGGAAGSTATVTLTNPLYGGTGPTSGTAITITVGAGGAGGAGGPIYSFNGYSYQLAGYASNGAAGAAGSVTRSWAVT